MIEEPKLDYQHGLSQEVGQHPTDQVSVRITSLAALPFAVHAYIGNSTAWDCNRLSTELF